MPSKTGERGDTRVGLMPPVNSHVLQYFDMKKATL